MENFTPKKKFEKLTIRTISHAFFALHLLKLPGVVEEGEDFSSQENYRGHRMFTFSLDEHFHIQLATQNHPDVIDSLIIRLNDKSHELDLYRFYNELSADKPDKEIEWKFDGPWVRMVEGKIKQIYQSYQFYLEKEKRKKERSEEYFRESLKNRQIFGSSFKIKVQEIYHLLSRGEKIGLVGNNGSSIFHYHYFVFQLHRNFGEKAIFSLTLKDGEYTFPIYTGEVDDREEVTLNDHLWANALAYSLEKLKREIEDHNRELSSLAWNFLNK